MLLRKSQSIGSRAMNVSMVIDGRNAVMADRAVSPIAVRGT